MDQTSDENKRVAGSFRQVNHVPGINSTEETSNSDDRFVLESPVELNSDVLTCSKGKIRESDANVSGLGSAKTVVDQEANGGLGILKPFDEGTSGNLSYLTNQVVLTSGGNEGIISGENNNSGIKIAELVLTGTASDLKTCVGRGNNEVEDKVGQGSYQDPNNNSTNGIVPETVILVNSEQNPSISGGNEQLVIKGRELGQSKLTVDKPNTKVSKAEKQSCVIDMKCGGGEFGFKDCDGERVCRICHLSSEGSAENNAATSSKELIQLGCGCKDELGIAHAYCAEAWFKLKGNRTCEICGETAKNITGVGDNRFMENWNQRRFIITTSSSSFEGGGGGCWRGQPFCNLLMACLVIAFVLPWFFRVNMF